jgi:elongation factor Tu
VLDAREGGRHTPFGTGYQPQFFFGPTDVTGAVEVVEASSDGGLVHPGQWTRVAFRLQRPIGLEPGMRFAIREGGRTVGAGRVTAVRS